MVACSAETLDSSASALADVVAALACRPVTLDATETICPDTATALACSAETLDCTRDVAEFRAVSCVAVAAALDCRAAICEAVATEFAWRAATLDATPGNCARVAEETPDVASFPDASVVTTFPGGKSIAVAVLAAPVTTACFWFSWPWRLEVAPERQLNSEALTAELATFPLESVTMAFSAGRLDDTMVVAAPVTVPAFASKAALMLVSIPDSWKSSPTVTRDSYTFPEGVVITTTLPVKLLSKMSVAAPLMVDCLPSICD